MFFLVEYNAVFRKRTTWMRYEGDIYRPPSEAYSYLLQVTIGCAHNKCTFCSMYKDKTFRLRPMEEVLEDLELARRTYSRVGRIFLCDGDALCLKTDKLIVILDKIAELFPECERVGVYGRSSDILRKTGEELKQLVEHGLKIVYVGAESGSDKVLARINKGVTRDEIKASIRKCEEIGLKTSVTFISGIGGRELWWEHAVETGRLISEMGASYASLLTLMIDSRAPIYNEINSGSFITLTAEEVVEETELLLESTNPWLSDIETVFRSNHASNYLSLKGNLPAEREDMLEKIRLAKVETGMLKDERFRML